MEGLIEEKISRLKDCLGYLGELKGAPLEIFITDFRLRDS